eukprot:363490-Chlamydomonas_euryale.AAC.2
MMLLILGCQSAACMAERRRHVSRRGRGGGGPISRSQLCIKWVAVAACYRLLVWRRCAAQCMHTGGHSSLRYMPGKRAGGRIAPC